MRRLESRTLGSDLSRLGALYRQNGYFGTRVVPEFEEVEEDGPVRLRMVVRRGDGIVVDSLAVDGTEGIADPDSLEALLPLQEDELFDLVVATTEEAEDDEDDFDLDLPQELPPPTQEKMREHVYDGIQEYDHRLPNWWLWTFYATIVWGIGYTIAYPAWPMISGATPGLLGFSTRGEVAEEIARAEDANSAIKARLAGVDDFAARHPG